MRRSALLALTLGGAGCLRTPPCEPDGLCFAATPVALRAVDRALGSADIDGDGQPDLVSVGGTGAALRRGRGDGSLSAAMVWSLPAEAEGLALGDLDGDGAQELVTTFPSRASLAWLHGVVGGWEADPRELEVGADIGALLTADLNGDGADELIASERARGRLHLWMGAASGPGMSRYVDIDDQAIALVAGDFRGDAGLELAAAIPSLGSVARFDFSPTTGLARAGTAWTSAFPVSLVAADLDADGHDDLAAIDSLDRTLWVGLGDGDGGWQRERTWPLTETPWQVFARRGPMAPELGILSGDRYGVTLIDPLSGATRIQAIAADPLRAVVAGDFAAGGSEELVYLHGSVAIVEELAGYRAQPLWTAPASGPTGVVAVVDLDGDEVAELIAEDTSQPALVVFAGSGSGYVEVARHPLADKLDGLRALTRGDGGADLVWWTSEYFADPSPFGVLTYTPGVGLAEAATQTMDEPILDIVAVDHDGDGWSDLAVTVELDDDSGLQALVTVARAPAGALTIGTRVLAGFRIDAVVAAQIDGLAGEDLWVTGDGDVWVVLGDFISPTPNGYGGPLSDRTEFLAADLDGDGQPDLVACDGTTGVEVAYGHADGSLDPPVLLSWLDPCDHVAACDLDADGDLDLVVERRRPFPAQRGSVEVLRADPDGWQATGAFADARGLLRTATACHGQQLLQWSGTASGATLREVVAGPALREAQPPGQLPGPVLAADLNGDGLDDLFTHDLGTPVLALALADGEGGHQPMQSREMPLVAAYVVFELETAELGGGPGKELLANISKPELGRLSWDIWSLHAGEIVTLGSLPAGAMEVGDIDGDGRDELLVGLGVSPQLLWFGADGASARTLMLDPALFAGVEAVRIADIDGDGQDDLLLRRGSQAPAIEVLRSRGDGSFEAPREWPLVDRLDDLGIGDVDADGAPDLVAFDYSGLHIAHGDGEGGMRALTRDPRPSAWFAPGPPLVDDLDGDGRAEVVLLVAEQGQADVLQVIRPGEALEAIPPWSLGVTSSSGPIVRIRLATDTPAWAVPGQQGAMIVTAGGGS